MNILSLAKLRLIDINRIKGIMWDEILERMRPKMWESGFCRNFMSDDNEHIWLWVEEDDDGEGTYARRTWEMKDDDFAIEGFSDEGPIVDGYGHGMVISDFMDLTLEQAIFVYEVMEEVA